MQAILWRVDHFSFKQNEKSQLMLCLALMLWKFHKATKAVEKINLLWLLQLYACFPLFASFKLSSAWNRGASSLQVVNSFCACLYYLPQEYNKGSWPTWHKSSLLKCYMCFQLEKLLFELIIGFFSWKKEVDWNKSTVWVKTSNFSYVWVAHKHNKEVEH